MNQNSSKLSKVILCIILGIILMSGCKSNEQAKDPVEVESSEPVEEKTQLELLAEEYEFLQWYLDDSTTKIVDGVTYDLVALKQEYGDLYRFVEPLSTEEVEYRFQYLAEYFADQAEINKYEGAPGGIDVVWNEVAAISFPVIKNNFKTIYESEDPLIEKFSNYYFYLEQTNGYYPNTPESLRYKGEYYPDLLINVVDVAKFEDKEWFIRDYASQMDVNLNSYIELNMDINFLISLENKPK